VSKPTESTVVRILLSFAAALAACTPSPQETAMHSPSPDPGTSLQGKSEAGSGGQASVAPDPVGRGSEDQEGAALAPIPEPVPVTDNPVPALPADSPAEAEGRRTLSTAFVMVGPDGRLTVELRNGRVLVLRDVVMRRKDYCGVQVLGGPAGAQYCGGYAEVAAARPGGAPAPAEPDVAVSNLVQSARSPAKRN
jgi:hypothetical protein